MSLYQDIIIDHYRNPRNEGSLKRATHHGEALNPTCGDRLQMDILLKDDMIEDVKFSGAGCAISIAAASLLTQRVQKKPVGEVLAIEPQEALGLLGISLSPARLKCGLLALETLKKTLRISKEP